MSVTGSGTGTGTCKTTRWSSAAGALAALAGLALGGGLGYLAVAPALQLGLALWSAPAPEPPPPPGLQSVRPASRLRRGGNTTAKFRGTELLKSLGFVPLCVLGYFCLLVLFGAPATIDHEATFSLAALLAILTVLPTSVYAGVDSTLAILTGSKWFSGDKFLEMLQLNALLTLAGAWCGGIVIPLDWDRPWQVWPIPCYLGAVFGYIISNVVIHVKLIPIVAKLLSRKTKYGFFL